MTIEDALRAGVHWSGGEVYFHWPEIGNDSGLCQIGLEGEAALIATTIRHSLTPPTYLKFGSKRYRLDRETLQLEPEETTQ